MSNTKQTAVEYLVKEFSDILGSIKTTPMQDMLIFDAINKAKQMEKEQIVNAYFVGQKEIAYPVHELLYEIPATIKEIQKVENGEQCQYGIDYYTQTYHAFKGELIQDEIGNLKPKNHGK